jgi:ABC-type multidrug transport system fused ATPase/permease subunit
MTTSNKKIEISVIGFILSVLLICGYFYFRIGQNGRQYNEFRAADAKIEPLFDTLNLSVHKNLPVPEGVQEIEQHSTNFPGHGKTLKIQYQFSNTSAENILSFYNQFLLSNGWILKNKSIDGNNYYKGTACVDIDSHEYNKDVHEFSIHIYHDYFAQSFSLDLLKDFPAVFNKKNSQTPIQEFGETYFLRCPGDSSGLSVMPIPTHLGGETKNVK